MFTFGIRGGDFFSEFLIDLFALLLELLTKSAIRIFFHSSDCNLSCENTARNSIVVFLIVLVIASLFYLLNRRNT
jgi:hypothetical protein